MATEEIASRSARSLTGHPDGRPQGFKAVLGLNQNVRLPSDPRNHGKGGNPLLRVRNGGVDLILRGGRKAAVFHAPADPGGLEGAVMDLLSVLPRINHVKAAPDGVIMPPPADAPIAKNRTSGNAGGAELGGDLLPGVEEDQAGGAFLLR